MSLLAMGLTERCCVLYSYCTLSSFEGKHCSTHSECDTGNFTIRCGTYFSRFQFLSDNCGRKLNMFCTNLKFKNQFYGCYLCGFWPQDNSKSVRWDVFYAVLLSEQLKTYFFHPLRYELPMVDGLT